MSEESMPGESMIAVETVLAAAVDSNGGSITVNDESLKKDFSDYVLALDYDYKSFRLVITLVDKETAVYEDE